MKFHKKVNKQTNQQSTETKEQQYKAWLFSCTQHVSTKCWAGFGQHPEILNGSQKSSLQYTMVIWNQVKENAVGDDKEDLLILQNSAI